MARKKNAEGEPDLVVKKPKPAKNSPKTKSGVEEPMAGGAVFRSPKGPPRSSETYKSAKSEKTTSDNKTSRRTTGRPADAEKPSKQRSAEKAPARGTSRGDEKKGKFVRPPFAGSTVETEVPKAGFRKPAGRRSVKAEQESPAEPRVFAFKSKEIDMPMAAFRAALGTKKGAKPANSQVLPSEQNLGQKRPQKGRDDRRQESPRIEEEGRAERGRRGGRPADRPETAKVAEEAIVAPPVKPIIQTPPDAPQVVVRNGVPTLVREGRVYPSIAFFGSTPDERRAGTVLEEIRLAAEADIHFHILLVEFEVDRKSVQASVSFAAYMLKEALRADPEAQVVFRLVFTPPKGWESKYPEAVYRDLTGRTADPSVSDEEFWGVARDCVSEFVRSIRLSDARDHILGVHLERGEWFLPEDAGYDDSKSATRGFREWARTRYRNDEVALRAAWFDGQANFETLQVPPFHKPSEERETFIRVKRQERKWVDYHLFLSDATAHRIGELAYAVKEASDGYFIVGVSYGYTFEWSHPYSGHLSLGKLLRTPEIDFIAGPPSYRSREPKGAAPFPSPIDSFPLSGKLYISEEDFKTSIGDTKEPDDFNPIIKTPQALESVHWRSIGAALAHASGVCWMDLWGNGWLKTPSIWKRGATARELLLRRQAAPPTDPDVAVFIDERALAYLVDQTSFSLLVHNVRESVLRSGLSAGFYLLSDLAHRETFPESKLNIMVNAWDVRSDYRTAIKNRLQCNGKWLFWLYCGGLFDAGREALERAREVTGIAIKPQPFHSKTGTTILNRRHPLCEAFPDRGTIGGGKLEPSYFAIPEDSTVLGEYTQTGLPSFVLKEHREGSDTTQNWTSVFLGEPVVSPALIRAMGQLAGAHVWNYQDDVVHVRPPYLTLHSASSGPRAVMLPNNWSAYDLLSDEWASMDSSNLRFNTLEGTTHMFLTGQKHEIENVLNCDPDELSRMEELPPRDENTVRFDLATLDVPIMQIDEFIDGGIPEDASDEWILRPRMFEQADEPDDVPAPAQRDTQQVGRRRRRPRRGRNGDNGKREEGFGELGMHVLFRKRE